MFLRDTMHSSGTGASKSQHVDVATSTSHLATAVFRQIARAAQYLTVGVQFPQREGHAVEFTGGAERDDAPAERVTFDIYLMQHWSCFLAAVQQCSTDRSDQVGRHVSA